MKEKKLRKTGIDILGDKPWGTHFCQFYQTKKDLLDILVPYFKAGLENNEFCMWITSEPLNTLEAQSGLKNEVQNLDEYIKRGQIEILDYTQWYTKSGKFNAERVLKAWVAKEKKALKKGFDGLRLTGNTLKLEKRDWKDYTDYKAAINNIIGKYRMMAICSYSLDKCGASEVIDAVSNHQFSLIKRKGNWELIESSERKQAEVAIKESEERFHYLFEMMTEGVVLIDSEGKIILANPAAERIAGLKRSEIEGSRYDNPELNLLHTDGTPMSPQEMAGPRTMKEKNPIKDMVMGVRRPDGCISWININTLPIFKDSGKIEHIILTFSDITEHKRAEELLLESEMKYRGLVEKATDSIYLITSDGFNYINPAFEELTGYSLKDVCKEEFKIWDIIHPDDHELIKERELARKKPERMPSRYEFRIITKNGEIKTVEPTTVDMSQKGEVKVMGILRDITERKKAEERLLSLTSMVEQSSESIVHTDTDFKIDYINDAASQLYGYTLEELKGKTADLFNAEPLGPEIQKEIYKTVSAGKNYEGEALNRRKDRSTFYCQFKVSPIYDDQGKICGYIGSQRDVTKRRLAEDALKESERRLRDLTEAAFEGVGIHDKGILLRANAQFFKMFGYESHELLGKQVIDITVAPESRSISQSLRKRRRDILSTFRNSSYGINEFFWRTLLSHITISTCF